MHFLWKHSYPSRSYCPNSKLELDCIITWTLLLLLLVPQCPTSYLVSSWEFGHYIYRVCVVEWDISDRIFKKNHSHYPQRVLVSPLFSGSFRRSTLTDAIKSDDLLNMWLTGPNLHDIQMCKLCKFLL